MAREHDFVDEIIRIEGDFVHDPDDQGNETRFGITVATARRNGYMGDMRELPIEKAKEILSADEGVSIEEVAERCGFDDYNYFISIFRKVVGTTPKKFWLEHRGDAISSEQALTPLL